MLHSRLRELQDYLANLPTCYLTDDSIDPGSSLHLGVTNSPVSFPIIRSIQALTARLSLLIPANHEAFQHESQAENSDVALVSLLGGMGKSIQHARSLGGKWSVVELARNGSQRENRSRWAPDEMIMHERVDGDL